MPREVVALVSADDVVAAIRVHADRVHDLLRRSGCGPEESVEVCESYAIGLIDAVVNAPETVGDMAGWWFGRALELGRRLGDAATEPVDQTEEAASVLSGTESEAQVRAALAALPEAQRAAVVLRDAYDLPHQAVAVALKRDEDAAAELVAAGRLELVARYDDRRAPDLRNHAGRTPADLGTLARVADGSLPTPRLVSLRRHLGSCPACEEVVEALARARRLAAALPVVAMPDEAREAMLYRVEERAAAVLPDVDEVLLAIEQDGDARPAISPVAVVLAIVIALVLGVAVAAITRLGSSGAAAGLGPQPTFVSETPSFSVSAEPRNRRSPKPTTSASALATSSATSSASATSSPTASTRSTRPAVIASITLSPTRGPAGTMITVTGTGWAADADVSITYRGTLPADRSESTTGTDQQGRFVTQIQASGTLPGSYTVTASDGSHSASATFQQTR